MLLVCLSPVTNNARFAFPSGLISRSARWLLSFRNVCVCQALERGKLGFVSGLHCYQKPSSAFRHLRQEEGEGRRGSLEEAGVETELRKDADPRSSSANYSCMAPGLWLSWWGTGLAFGKLWLLLLAPHKGHGVSRTQALEAGCMFKTSSAKNRLQGHSGPQGIFSQNKSQNPRGPGRWLFG